MEAKPQSLLLRPSDWLGEGRWMKVAQVTLALPTAPLPRPRQEGDRREGSFSRVLPFLQRPEIAHLLVHFKTDILSKEGHRLPRESRGQEERGPERGCFHDTVRTLMTHAWMGHRLQPTIFSLEPK